MITISFRQFAGPFQKFEKAFFREGQKVDLRIDRVGGKAPAKIVAFHVDEGGHFIDLTVGVDNDVFSCFAISPVGYSGFKL